MVKRAEIFAAPTPAPSLPCYWRPRKVGGLNRPSGITCVGYHSLCIVCMCRVCPPSKEADYLMPSAQNISVGPEGLGPHLKGSAQRSSVSHQGREEYLVAGRSKQVTNFLIPKALGTS